MLWAGCIKGRCQIFDPRQLSMYYVDARPGSELSRRSGVGCKPWHKYVFNEFGCRFVVQHEVLMQNSRRENDCLSVTVTAGRQGAVVFRGFEYFFDRPGQVPDEVSLRRSEVLRTVRLRGERTEDLVGVSLHESKTQTVECRPHVRFEITAVCGRKARRGQVIDGCEKQVG